MPYRVVVKAINITGREYNSWEEFKPVYNEYMTDEERIDFFIEKANDIGYPPEDIVAFENFITNPSMTVEWNNDVQEAVITVDWPNVELYNMFDLCKSYMSSINALIQKEREEEIE